MSEWKKYRKKALSYVEMRPYVPGEDLSGVSVSKPDDPPTDRGYVARNPDAHADEWYVARKWFDENYEPLPRRDSSK